MVITNSIMEEYQHLTPYNKFIMPPDEITREWVRLINATTPLEVLGFPKIPDSRQDIQHAYLKLARTLHPDVIRELPEEWRDYANQAMGRINQAYSDLESQALYFGEVIGKSELEGRNPLEQLVVLLNNLFPYAMRDTVQTFSGSGLGGLFGLKAIMGGYTDELFIIKKAYLGDPNYAPQNGSPLPDINEVLSALKQGKMVEKWIDEHVPGYALRTEPRIVIDPNFYVPDGTHSRVDAPYTRFTGAYSWPGSFIESNGLPTIAEAERRRLEQERKSRYGGVLGWLANRIKPVTVDIGQIDRTVIIPPVVKRQETDTGTRLKELPSHL